MAEEEIKKAENDIADVVAELRAPGLTKEDKSRLWNKEEQLRSKEKQLQNKEAQLREEKLILLRQQQGKCSSLYSSLL